MLITDIKRVVEQVSRDKGIDREVLIKALQEALGSAAKKKFGGKGEVLDIEDVRALYLIVDEQKKYRPVA